MTEFANENCEMLKRGSNKIQSALAAHLSLFEINLRRSEKRMHTVLIHEYCANNRVACFDARVEF